MPGGLGRRVSSLVPAAALAEHDQQPLKHAPDPPDGAAVGPVGELGSHMLYPPCPLQPAHECAHPLPTYPELCAERGLGERQARVHQLAPPLVIEPAEQIM